MCRETFWRVAFIFDLLLQTFHFIQGISTTSFPLCCINVTIVKGMGSIALINVVCSTNPDSGFSLD